MPISDVISISISVSGAGPTREGFGEPLIASYHTFYTDRVREYDSPAAIVADGFPVTHPAYLAASAVFAQSPSPANVKIGRRALAFTQVLHMQCLSTSALDTYVFKIGLPGTTLATVSVASTGVPNTDVATINTAVTALGLTGLTATHATDTLTLTMTAGKLLNVVPDYVHTKFSDVTTDPGIATDLAAILNADSNWYGLLLDCQSPAEDAAAETWVEANKKLFTFNCSDSDCLNPSSTTDIFYTSKQAAYTRSEGLFTGTLLSYSAAAWQGRLLPTDPGSENWAFKTLASVPADVLTDNQIHAVENKNASVYTTIFGLNLTQFGKVFSGEWLDITRGVDALTNDMQVSVLALQANNLKIPFTDAGIDMYRSTLLGSLKRFEDIGFLATTPPPFVSLPKASAVDPTNKAARNLPLVSFSATLAGAINSTQVQGVLSS